MEELKTPKQSKGGVIAPADVEIIKRALEIFLRNNEHPVTAQEEKQIANLLHRLNNRI